MTGRLARLTFFTILILLVLIALYSPTSGLPRPTLSAVQEGEYFTTLDRYISDGLPGLRQLRQLHVELSTLAGRQRQNDVFFSEEGIIRNIDAPSDVLVEENVNTVLEFAALSGTPTYLMLIPTASAILQQQIPTYAEIYNNQKQFIEQVYRQMSGKVTVIDVYPVLFNRRDQYLYYRTEDNLTALGGFYIYTVMEGKLGRLGNGDLSYYDIEYITDEYYGDLSRQYSYREVRPDVLMVFHYNRYLRKYTVTHREGEALKTYHTLYPTHLADLDEEMGVYLGGVSAITDIKTSNSYRSLLVFGDKTAQSYLPFVANGYGRITLVDLYHLSAEEYASINLDEYDQVLFAYSTETFDSTTPRLAGRILENNLSDLFREG